MGKLIKSLLFVWIALILLNIPNANAEELEGENNGIDYQITEEAQSRPTLLPDLTLSSADIKFSNEMLEEENIIIIEATIHNNGFVGAFAYIEFYKGNLYRDNLIGTGTLFVKRRDTNVISIGWVAISGKHDIFVIIKDSTPRELVKWNNVADNTLDLTGLDEPGAGAGDGGIYGNDNGDDHVDLVFLPLDNPVISTGVAGGLALLLFALANKHYCWIGNLGLIPLYSRITNGQVLNQNTRRTIYEYIASNPGTYLSSIMKDLKLKNGVTSYHLSKLEKEGYITSRQMGIYRLFYIEGAAAKDLPRSKMRSEIIKTIVKNPGISQTEIASGMGASNQAVNYHIGILRKANIIRLEKEGFRTRCFKNDV